MHKECHVPVPGCLHLGLLAGWVHCKLVELCRADWVMERVLLVGNGLCQPAFRLATSCLQDNQLALAPALCPTGVGPHPPHRRHRWHAPLPAGKCGLPCFQLAVRLGL